MVWSGVNSYVGLCHPVCSFPFAFLSFGVMGSNNVRLNENVIFQLLEDDVLQLFPLTSFSLFFADERYQHLITSTEIIQKMKSSNDLSLSQPRNRLSQNLPTE